uniref:Uncharacterized protein n=1 Tax=Oryza nivara TaxID=4536 RepID=A0A0E0GR71_ORYNI
MSTPKMILLANQLTGSSIIMILVLDVATSSFHTGPLPSPPPASMLCPPQSPVTCPFPPSVQRNMQTRTS